MFTKVKKRVQFQKLSKLGRKILNTPYNRESLVNERFNEVNNILGEDKLTKKEISSLVNRGIEPIMHIYKNSFLISNFERHTFGVANLKTKKIIIPCEYFDIEFDKNNIVDESIEVKVLNIENNTVIYSVNDSAILKNSSAMSYFMSMDSIPRRFTPLEGIGKKDSNKDISTYENTEFIHFNKKESTSNSVDIKKINNDLSENNYTEFKNFTKNPDITSVNSKNCTTVSIVKEII